MKKKFNLAWVNRIDSDIPFDWQAFPDEAIVQFKTAGGSKGIAQSRNVNWLYIEGNDNEAESSVVMHARRLDRKLI